jgi:hypothetical protein
MHHLGDALDRVRRSGHARPTGTARRFIEGWRYTLLPERKNSTLKSKRSLKLSLAANQRPDTACLLNEFLRPARSCRRES